MALGRVKSPEFAFVGAFGSIHDDATIPIIGATFMDLSTTFCREMRSTDRILPSRSDQDPVFDWAST